MKSDAHVSALDWPAMLAALSQCCRTPMGRREAATLAPLPDVASVHAHLDEVGCVLDLWAAGRDLPVGGVGDVGEPVGRAGKGAVLDKTELRSIGLALAGLHDLDQAVAAVDRSELRALAPRLRVDPDLRETLRYAFDPTGDLSGLMWPELAQLRDRIAGLHTAVRRTLDELIRGDELADALQDRFVTQRGDRYVIPIKINHKRKDMGIVHAVSGSGQTAFIEPHQVVALNNELRLAEGELQAAERRILTQLSGMVGALEGSIEAALAATTQLDLAVARAELAQKLRATRPVVRGDGVVNVRDARHPLLALRGVPVVGNDLHLSDTQPILIISGPNTGGKTVALKTIGLCALLVRVGCWIPAAPDSRVDLFHHVEALIGDHQTVHGDHSSFSSHVKACREMLDVARPGCLFLIDEIASGTDPQQGAALAHALLEELLEKGPRAVVTTHFHRLKTIGATDPRFAMGGMQFAEGRPTFRLRTGISGESHALSVASQQGLPPALIARAKVLMGSEEQGLADVLARLEQERIKAEDAHRRAVALEAGLIAEREALARQQEQLRARARELEAQLAAGFRERVEAAERAISAVVADLQREPSHRKVQAARASLEALQGVLPAPNPAAPAAPASVQKGDRVRLRKLGHVGTVTDVGEQITVHTGALSVRVRPEDIEPIGGAARPKLQPQRATPSRAPRKTALTDAVRFPENTLDLRGARVEDGLEAAQTFLADAIGRSAGFVFILHGHGTGAMKEAIRRWLPTQRSVGEWGPAHAEQGGDAYTAIILR